MQQLWCFYVSFQQFDLRDLINSIPEFTSTTVQRVSETKDQNFTFDFPWLSSMISTYPTSPTTKKKQTNKQCKAIQPFHSREVCRGIAICFCSICFAVLSDFKWRYDILSSFKICISQFFMFCGMVAMVTSLKLRGFLGYLTLTWENWKFGWKIKRRWPYLLGNRGEERWEDEHLFTWFGYNLYWVFSWYQI